MQELQNMLSEKLGLDASLSQQAVTMVLSFIKEKIPANMHGVLDAALKGDISALGDVSDTLNQVKGFFK